MKQLTRYEYEAELNELGVPFEDQKENGGRISDRAKYGTWMRHNDPVAFNVGLQERRRNIEYSTVFRTLLT